MPRKPVKSTVKVDLVSANRQAYSAPVEPELVTLPRARFLSVEGEGSPESAGFRRAVGALYGAAWTIKMASKAKGRDFKVAPLEGLWEGGYGPGADKDGWRWKLLIRVPGFVAEPDLCRAREALVARGKGEGLDAVELEDLKEGRCVQVLHLGPYADEPATVERMKAFAQSHGLTARGRHHEVYLSDPGRTAPARLRTVLRQPVS